MLREFVMNLSRIQKRMILQAMDLVLVPFALFVAVALEGWSALLAPLRTPEISMQFLAMSGVLALAAWLFSDRLGLPRIKLKSFENSAILRTGIFAALTALTGAVLRPFVAPDLLPTSSFVVFGMVLAILAVVVRFVGLWVLLRLYSNSSGRKRVLIYGAGQTGVQLALALKTDPDLRPVAFVDDNPTLWRMMVAGLAVLPPRQLGDLVREMNIDRVVVAMPSIGRAKQAQLSRELQRKGCEVRVVPSFAALVDDGSLVERIKSPLAVDFLNREGRSFDHRRVRSIYRERSVLVSGAGGSIGSELARQIISMAPKRLILFELSEPALYEIDRELRDLMTPESEIQIIPILGNVTDAKHLRDVITTHQVGVIVHAAAYKHVPMVESNPLAGLSNNVIGTRTLAEVARDTGVGRFVLVSTDKAVRPTNIMGASKRLAELMVQDLARKTSGTKFSIVRFGNVLGSSGSVVPLFQDQISRGGPVTVTDPEVTRYFMTIGEAAHLVLMAGAMAEGGEVFVLDMGNPVPIRLLARQMIERSGYSVRDADNPEGDIEIIYSGLRPGEKLYEELFFGGETERTEHDKIMKSHETQLSEIELAAALRDVSRAVELRDADRARAAVRRWVEGYHQPAPHPGPQPAQPRSETVQP